MERRMVTLKIEFESKEILEHFASWLCNAGEQVWWDCLSCQDLPDQTIEYYETFPEFPPNDKRHYGRWLPDNTIKIREKK